MQFALVECETECIHRSIIAFQTFFSVAVGHSSFEKEANISCAGLQTSQNGKFYAMSTKFDKFSNEEKTLVVQFTVKHEQKIDCGGGYVKVSLIRYGPSTGSLQAKLFVLYILLPCRQ